MEGSVRRGVTSEIIPEILPNVHRSTAPFDGREGRLDAIRAGQFVEFLSCVNAWINAWDCAAIFCSLADCAA